MDKGTSWEKFLSSIQHPQAPNWLIDYLPILSKIGFTPIELAGLSNDKRDTVLQVCFSIH